MFNNQLLFCDNSDLEVLTTQTANSYQWYKQQWSVAIPNPNPWLPIAEATNQTYTVKSPDDKLYYFKVASTINSCTEFSPEILVDGYAFALPVLQYSFTPGTYLQTGASTYNVCQGASVLLQQDFPVVYGVHKWFNCIPTSADDTTCLLPGVTGDSYTATTTGTYGFIACTEYCPNVCYVLGGSWPTFNFGTWDFCNLETENPSQNAIHLYPNPSVNFIYIGQLKDYSFIHITILDNTGKTVLQKNNHNCNESIDISTLARGTYLIIGITTDEKVFKNKFIKN